MYIIINASKNLMRYGRRWCITAAGSILFITFLFYSVFYHVSISEYNRNAENEYLSRAELRFRDELQYLGNRKYTEGMDWFFAEEQNFNNDSSMDRYDFLQPFSRELLSLLEESGCVSESAYCAEVYADLPGKENRTKLTLYGGNTDTLIRYKDELRRGENFSLAFEIVEGRAAGRNECVLYREFADSAGIRVGDKIPFFSSTGESLDILTVSGLIEAYSVGYDNRRTLYHSSELNYTVGSMPYDRIAASVYDTVFTDFDTAYSFYGGDGTEHYNFNNYLLIFKLDSRDSIEKLNRKAAELIGSDFFAFYPLYGALLGHEEYYEQELCEKVIAVCLIMSVTVIVLSVFMMLRERRREFAVIHSLGIGHMRIFASLSAEIFFFITAVSSAAMLFSSFLDVLWKILGTGFFIDRFRFVLSQEGVLSVITVSLCYFVVTAGIELIYILSVTERRCLNG